MAIVDFEFSRILKKNVIREDNRDFLIHKCKLIDTLKQYQFSLLSDP